MTEPKWTIGQILNTSCKYLEKKGIESPRRSAELLLGKILSFSRIDLYTNFDRPLTNGEIGSLRDLIKRRAHHEPLQYILGEVEFYGLRFEVSPGLLVPRPETELLAELAIKKLAEKDQSTSVRALDIGTGTGCLAITIAAHIPKVYLDAVDVAYEACACTTRNATAHGVIDRIRIINTDLFSSEFTRRLDAPYDLVLSNPPYITESEHHQLDREIRDFESKDALIGGSDGLKYYRRIAELLPDLLKPSGWFACEIGYGQEENVKEIFGTITRNPEIHRDLSGIPRVISGYRETTC